MPSILVSIFELGGFSQGTLNSSKVINVSLQIANKKLPLFSENPWKTRTVCQTKIGVFVKRVTNKLNVYSMKP